MIFFHIAQSYSFDFDFNFDSSSDTNKYVKNFTNESESGRKHSEYSIYFASCIINSKTETLEGIFVSFPQNLNPPSLQWEKMVNKTASLKHTLILYLFKSYHESCKIWVRYILYWMVGMSYWSQLFWCYCWLIYLICCCHLYYLHFMIQFYISCHH